LEQLLPNMRFLAAQNAFNAANGGISAETLRHFGHDFPSIQRPEPVEDDLTGDEAVTTTNTCQTSPNLSQFGAENNLQSGLGGGDMTLPDHGNDSGKKKNA
jgi:hypothetical protein